MATDRYALSIVIPTYNRSEILDRCLAAISKQTYPRDDFEVIVVDDGSQDSTQSTADRWLSEPAFNLKYLRQPNSGANVARNFAIRESEGRLLLFINDDTIAAPTMIAEHIRTHQQYAAENIAVLGRITISAQVPPSLFAKLHLDADYDLWAGKKDLDWRAFYTCNVSVKKSFLINYGFFEEAIRYHDDIELGQRLSHFGLRIIYNPEALGYHSHFLQEKEYLDIGRRDGVALAKWYKKAPNLRGELASIGLHLTAPLRQRMKYLLADCLINAVTRPLILRTARFFSNKNERIALLLYRKVFQSLKRQGVRDEMRR
jgi:glycosyltransferase involved in cell wall biosynthesis